MHGNSSRYTGNAVGSLPADCGLSVSGSETSCSRGSLSSWIASTFVVCWMFRVEDERTEWQGCKLVNRETNMMVSSGKEMERVMKSGRLSLAGRGRVGEVHV